MNRLLITSLSLALCGCATTDLTMDGAGVVAMWQSESAGMLSSCDRLGTVYANSASVFGGMVGRSQAITDAKNKAAAIGGDTVVLTGTSDDFSGTHMNGVAFRCHGATPKKIVVKTEDPIRVQTVPDAASSTNKYDDLEKLEKLREAGVITQAEFEIEKKKILAR